jgi:hypothetical protein
MLLIWMPSCIPVLFTITRGTSWADARLSTGEKRAILASWASDAAAVASNPAFRELPGSHRIVTIDEVLEALSELDHGPKGPPGGKPARLRSTSRVAMAA